MQRLLARADKTGLFYAHRVCSFFTVSSLATAVPCTHLLCFVIEWVWWDQNNLLTYHHNRILFMQYTLKWKTNKETTFILFVNCSSLAPDTTINVSVHQVFEEKVPLNFIYWFQSPETLTIVPLSHCSKIPRVVFVLLFFFPKSSNTSQHIPVLKTTLCEKHGIFCVAFSSVSALLLQENPAGTTLLCSLPMQMFSLCTVNVRTNKCQKYLYQ